MKSFSIELLSPSLIECNRSLAAHIDKMANSLWRDVGWHYYLDFIWIIKQLKECNIPMGSTIIDAGAGNGLMQYLLAEEGYYVFSVDFSKRRFPLLASFVFPIIKNKSQKEFVDRYITHIDNESAVLKKIKRLPAKLFKNRFDLLGYSQLLYDKTMKNREPGTIVRYRMDMCNMDAISSNSIDAVVSVSSIEHMSVDKIPEAVKEFNRVLKSDGAIFVTTSAALDDYYHEPSEGWCFSECTLRNLFGFPKDEGVSAFDDYDKVMKEVIESEYLKSRLSSLYYSSGDNGMPWGIWDPKYLPVGIKIKNVYI